jgi:predicted O-methyltransferase YrrM
MKPRYERWFAGKSFSTDWTSRHFPLWEECLPYRRKAQIEVLEIGSWEGRSALFFLNHFHNARLTCIDTFEGSAEHHVREKWTAQLGRIEGRFDANVAEFGDRVEKLKTTSLLGLAGLIAAGRGFDVALIDGSHHSADVLADAAMTWPMIRPGGIVIFDDYEWGFEAPEIEKPKLGIDAFLATHAQDCVELHRGYQVIVRKAGAAE